MAELPKIKKNLKGEIKGTIRGTRGGSRNDLKNPNWRLQAKGEGGVPSEKWDDPSKKKGPFVPPPKLARYKKTNSPNA